ncbi:MAG: hypothetical protein KGZ96_06460 [Clostridia bacterium]|jgi:predicted  nucleic acid-binding Zn ribbon protein|nr:hypothetical protein [Clostridia bacterium]
MKKFFVISKRYEYKFATPLSGEKIANNISKILKYLGEQLNYNGKIVGHIKAIVLAGENYLQMSLTSMPKINIKSDNNWYEKDYTEVELNINIIIYGFNKEQVHAYLDESMGEFLED